MTHHDRYTSLLWGVLGLYVTFEGWRLQVGTIRRPEAGFMVFWAGMILFSLSSILFLHALSNMQRKETKPLWKEVNWRKGVKVMAALFFFALIFRPAGFLMSTFFLLLFLLKGVEPQKWRAAVLISVLTIAFCYLVFVVLFEAQFPAGILGKIFS